MTAACAWWARAVLRSSVSTAFALGPVAPLFGHQVHIPAAPVDVPVVGIPETCQGPKLIAFAVAYAKAGFTPVLLNPCEKTPAFKGWQDKSMAEVVGELSVCSSYNLGVAMPEGYFVLDIDVKNGQNGMATLEAWEAKFGPLKGMLIQNSPSGGFHYLFRLPTGVQLKNAVKFAPGLDVRARGGFIAVEPSAVNGSGYWWQDWDVLTEPIPEVSIAPDWLVDLCPKHEGVAEAKNNTEGDNFFIVEGQRNDVLFRKACALRGQGFNEQEIGVAIKSLNERSCRPPLPARDVALIAKSAATYQPNPEVAVPRNQPLRRDFALKARTAARLFVGEPKPVRWLVERIFPLGKVAIIASPPGIGKSLSALELALHVTSGAMPPLVDGARFGFGGRVLGRGRAVYISAEDDDEELHRRAHALLDGQPMPDRLHFVSLPDQGHFTFVQGDARTGMKRTEEWAALRDEMAQFDDVQLIIVDTFQALSAGDLNAAEVAQAMMNELVELANQTGAAVIALHHLTKVSASIQANLLNAHFAMDAVRGSGAIAGSARAVYAMFPHPKGKEVCEVIGIEYEENKVVYGLVAKANGDARREYTIYIRDENGVLRDRTLEYRRRIKDDGLLLATELLDAVTDAHQKGRSFAASPTSANGLHKRRFELPKQFHDMPANWFAEHAEALVRDGRLQKQRLNNGYQYVPVVPVTSAAEIPAEFSAARTPSSIKRGTKGGATKKVGKGRSPK